MAYSGDKDKSGGGSGGGMHDAWYFIGVFALIFLIWISTGGPLRPLSFSGPRLALPGVLGGGTYLQLPRAQYGIGDSNVVLDASGNNASDSSNDQNNRNSSRGTPKSQLLPNNSTFGIPSPYRDIVRMRHSVSGAGSVDPKNEYVEISVDRYARTPVTISGWKLVSDATGTIATIPKGTEVPVSGVISASQDIILAPGKKALIISGSSSIGASFRENKCMGYFSSVQKFYPPLPQNCPAPSDELLKYYGPGYIRDVSCIEQVQKISRCQVMITPPTNVSSACGNLITQYLNYGGCLDAHKNDTDFKGDLWRIYLDRTTPLWRTKYEIVKLLDTEGKTVDMFDY